VLAPSAELAKLKKSRRRKVNFHYDGFSCAGVPVGSSPNGRCCTLVFR